MPTIGPITIPEPPDVGTWPLVADHGSSVVIRPRFVEHRFGASNAKVTQRFRLGPDLREFNFRKSQITRTEMDSLMAFWDAAKGPYSIFDYSHRANDGTNACKVRFVDPVISWEFLQSCVTKTGVRLVEVRTSAPTYAVASTLDRFPNSTLNTALLSQVQELIPLVRLRVKDAGVADIFLSDRLCVVGGNRYEPRILQWSGISQTLGEQADSASFTLGNADDVFTDLVDAVDLSYARLEFSLYHVQTQIKLDLWTGFLAADGAWSLDESAATMQIQATDGLATTTAAFPPRAIAQSCWKELGGPYCPVSTAGINAGTPCDKGHDTPAGCVFHGMEEYFGGVKVFQQEVKLRTNTSFWGPRASTISASSVINEAATGRPLKLVYTDIPMPVPCDVIAGRDESDYRSALAIIGQGPIASINPDLTQQTLDGVGPHGGVTGLGFRLIPGNDPVTDLTKHRMSLDEASSGWNPPSGTPFAAGVAAIQVRRTDNKGIQGFRPSDWQVQSSVSGGVGGWKWTSVGTRVWVPAMTNNVWLTVNGWLMVNGAWCDNEHASAVSVGAMETLFDVDASIASAAICDASVTPIIGSGSETQFKFCGIIGDFKPFRQWAQIILNGALCDYTFRNAKIKITARVNASSTSGFGPGNTIFRSLDAQWKEPDFNHLTVEFGDSEHNFQRNAVPLYDETHGKRRAISGGMAAYKKQTANPAGCVTKSQAARLVITLLREELGGITATEQRKSRNITWASTVLALEVDPGQVASFTGFRKIPDGTKARVSKWVLNPDYSITFYGSTVTDSMYDYTIGPKPQDVLSGPADVERAPAIKYRRWFPNHVAPDAGDAVFSPFDLSFSAGISYEDYADGSKRAILSAEGRAHVNAPLLVDPPQIRTITFSSTGGSLEGTHPLYFSIVPYDASGRRGPRSRTGMVYLDAATSTCSANLSNVTWPSGTWSGHLVYAGREESQMCLYQSATGTPSSITITGPARKATEGPPEAGDLGYRLKAKELAVPGAVKAVVTSLPTISKVICSSLAGGSVSYTGERCMVIGDASDGFAPLRTWNITAHNQTTGEFTFDRTHAGTDPLQAGDTILVLARATGATTTTVSCSKLAMTADAHVGKIVRIFAGFGAVQYKRIVANDGTSITVDSPWDATPDTTAFWWVESFDWQYQSPTTAAVSIVDASQLISLRLPLENFEGRTILVMGFLVDAEGTEGFEYTAPFRVVEVVGSSGVAPGNDPPGPIRQFALRGTAISAPESIDTTSKPGFALVPVEFLPPSPDVNNFDRVKCWITVAGGDEIEINTITHPIGSAGLGDGTVEIPLAGVDLLTVVLWGASGSATWQNSLVTASGAGQTPFIALGTLPAYTVGSPAAPEVPLGASLVILDHGDNYSLQVTITPPSSLGGTVGYQREVKFYNNAGLTVEDHPDWIELGFVDLASAVSVSGPHPRPDYNQWVKCRVRAVNWADGVTAWVESSAVALTPLALPPAITTNDSTVELIDAGDISQFLFHLALTPAGSLGTTTWYEAYVKYFNNSGLTIEDHPDWIYLGGIDLTGVLDTSRFDRRNINQWAVIRIYGKNQANKLGAGVNSATLVIPARPAAATSGATMYVTGPATAVRVSPVTYSADGIEQTEIDVDWIQPTNTDARTILVTVTNPADAGDTDRETHREKIGDWATYGASRSLRVGPWPTKTETTRVKIWTINRDDVQLASPVTIDVSITAGAGAINLGRASTATIDLTNFVISSGKLDIVADGIGTNEIASLAVTAAEIANATITGAKIASATISGSNIASATITGANIVAATITGSNIASATIAGSQIQSATITSTQIASATIVAANIAANTITGAQIQDGSITAAEIANLTITAANIASLTITAAQIQDLTINGAKITDSAITNPKVATGTLSGDKLQNATITGTQIAAATIAGLHIQNATITGSKIANATITGVNIANASIAAANIQALTITANEIANLTITSGKIASITADKITAGTITASIIMTAPTIQVTGSGYTVNIDSSTAIRVTGSFTGYTSYVNSAGFVTQSASGQAELNPSAFFVGHSSGNRVSIDANASGAAVTVRNTSFAGMSIQPGSISCGVNGGNITMNGSNQYVSAAQFRLGGNFASSGATLDGYTISWVWYIYNSSGTYLGFVPILN